MRRPTTPSSTNTSPKTSGSRSSLMWRTTTTSRGRKSISVGKTHKMKILLIADLHLNIPASNPRSGRSAMEDFAEAIRREKPEVVVVAGDIGAAGHAARHFTEIRNAVGDRPLAITLGNHDFWLSSIGHAQFSHLNQVVTRYWCEPARDLGYCPARPREP
ncbi:MAG: metallophosphoesterase [Chthoniobacterales bacterium]|nr:metallophosphoesterase [Chthoniobacterales bacterium]